ncbi:hypothetical protein HPB50_010100 [Hyalomma asiaticum]|uniref:Uncharacterized protein n=1 Tax=Hyalomma asiaticum TaxID=266040 RepID=A0ACB7RTX3_HYAAI|nr:hypothetical protein HPB50_010100 [Hyalomma asiaticum]
MGICHVRCALLLLSVCPDGGFLVCPMTPPGTPPSLMARVAAANRSRSFRRQLRCTSALRDSRHSFGAEKEMASVVSCGGRRPAAGRLARGRGERLGSKVSISTRMTPRR